MELVDSSYAPTNPADAVVDDLAGQIVGLAGRLAAGTCRWLLLVADFDARDGHLRFGLASTAQWLSHACGIAQRTAVDHLRVARTLAAHTALASEMAAGRLSYSQVRAISRVARPDEDELVADLIEAARHGTVAHLEVLVRGLRTVDDNEAGCAHDEYVRHRWTEQSHWQLSAKLDPERGAVVVSALNALAQAENLSETAALVRLAEIGLAALADGTGTPRHLRGDEQAAVVVHLDEARIAAMSSDDEAAAGSAEPARAYARVAGGPGLPDRVVKRLLCSGRVRTIVRAGSNVLDVGRSHRLVTDRQYRALLIRHHGQCAHPGCPNTKNLHAHHLLHWLHGGRTDLDNLILLCEPHHLAHHDGAFTITALPNDEFRFVYTDGHEVSTPRDAAATGARPYADAIEDEYGYVAPDAATSRWDGQRLDRGYAVGVLADRRQKASE